MKTASMRVLIPAFALALASGIATAQTTGSASTGSSATGGQNAPAAQPATGTNNSKTTSDKKVARSDRKFMDKAAGDGMYEVQVGQLAANKASDPNVKSFASKLVDDHTAANKELVQLANSQGVELPAAPPRGKRRDIEKLGKESGAKFDHQFVREQVKDHEKDVKEFQKVAAKTKDAELKAWIDKTLPTLREHLQMAQQLESGKAGAAMGNRGSSKSETSTGK